MAVNVTVSPMLDGFSDEPTVVDVDACPTVTAVAVDDPE
jgi:hypothetical protein